jgi:hypothetical protein
MRMVTLCLYHHHPWLTATNLRPVVDEDAALVRWPPQCSSARLAKKEHETFVSVATKPTHLKALREGLVCCSIVLKKQVKGCNLLKRRTPPQHA